MESCVASVVEFYSKNTTPNYDKTIKRLLWLCVRHRTEVLVLIEHRAINIPIVAV